MALIDIFTGDAFKTTELTAAVNAVTYKPNWLGSLNIFDPRPVRTTSIAIEKVDQTLSLVQTTPRGVPLAQQRSLKRTIRDFRTVRVAKGDRLMADEIQSIRAFGSETELQQAQTETLTRMLRLRNDVELTHENMMLGAVQGLVLDADGSTINDWFAEWGITQAAEVNWDLDNASPASGVVKKKCNATIRAMKVASKGAWVDNQTTIIGLCGDNFYDSLTAHTEVRGTYLNQSQANDLRGDTFAAAFDAFKYGGITFVNYRGTDDGTIGVGADKVKFFPVNAPGAFLKAQAPGETFDWANTPGQPVYAMVVPDRDRNMYVDLEVYSYPLYVCTRPAMLQRGKRT